MVPVELLREVVLAYLADTFLDLIVDPKVEKDWDPLSPLLHTSTQLRHVTAGFLKDIFGDLGPQRGQRTIANYRLGLAELKRVHALAYTVNPKLFLDPISISSIYPPKDCRSPMIGTALEFAMTNVHYRLYEPSSNATLDEASQAYLSRPSWTPPMDGVPSNVAWRIFSPISERTMSVNHLVQRILSLQEACFMAFEIERWQQPSHAFDTGSEYHDLLVRMLKISRDTKQSAVEFKRRGFRVRALPIPRHIIEATEPHDALFNLEPPAGQADDDPMTRFCRGLQLVILQCFYNKQRDAMAADLIARTASRDNAMADSDDSDDAMPDAVDSDESDPID